MKRTTVILSSLAAGLVLTGLVTESVLAERGWRGHRGGPLGGPRAELMYEALDLSTEQRQAIEAIQANYRPQLQALRENSRDSRRALRDTTPDASDYATVVAEASQAAAEHASQLVLLTAELRREVHAVLTPEQQEKALKMRDTMKDRFEERRERRRAGRQLSDGA